MGDGSAPKTAWSDDRGQIGRPLPILLAVMLLVVGASIAASLIVENSSQSQTEERRISGATQPPPPVPADATDVVTTPFGSSYTAPAGHTTTQLGCLDDLSAESLDAFFAERLGPSVGQDNPHIYELRDDRYLWLFNDGFVDYTGDASNIVEHTYVRNLGLLQDGTCFDLIHGGTREDPQAFEQGRPDDTKNRWFWPLGGEIGADGKLYIFWTHMVTSRLQPGPRDGIKRHPVDTWIATYDPATLERLSFQRAPNDGVEPIFGFAVESSGNHSYLFGNSYQLNLRREGGYGNGPFSGTRMYLARVPRGDFLAEPEYYDGRGWSARAGDAEPISDRFEIENAMHPQVIDGRWISITGKDALWSHDNVVDVADEPWGPWTPMSLKAVPGRFDGQLSYYPIILPWRDPSGDLIVVLSLNYYDWSVAAGSVTREYYRPIVYREPWPDEPGTGGRRSERLTELSHD